MKGGVPGAGPELRDAPTANGDQRAEGFTLDELRDIQPLALVTAKDFWTLNQGRLENYRRAGVSSGLLDSLQLLRMVVWVEERFGVKVGDEDLIAENLRTPARVAAFVGRRAAPAGIAS